LIILIIALASCTSENSENAGDLEYSSETQMDSEQDLDLKNVIDESGNDNNHNNDNSNNGSNGGDEEDYEDAENEEEKLRLLLEQEAEERRQEWEAAEHGAVTGRTLLPLIEFAEQNPESEFIGQAYELLEKMRGDSDYYTHENLDEVEYFIANFPEHKDMELALERRKDFEKNLVEFAQSGDVSGRIAGKSIHEIDISIRNNTESRLIIHLPLGLYFMANSGNVQNMVLTESMSVSIAANEGKRFTAAVACMNIYKDIPDETSVFSIDMLDEDDPLLKLLDILIDNDSVFETAQAAIWHLRDRPGKQTMMEVLEYDDGEQAITEEHYAEAIRLVGILG
jgi:hypothetical protein